MKITQKQANEIEKICDRYIESPFYMTEAEDAITDIMDALKINYQYVAGKLVINLDEEDLQ